MLLVSLEATAPQLSFLCCVEVWAELSQLNDKWPQICLTVKAWFCRFAFIIQLPTHWMGFVAQRYWLTSPRWCFLQASFREQTRWPRDSQSENVGNAKLHQRAFPYPATDWNLPSNLRISWRGKTQPEFRSSFRINPSIRDNLGKRDWYLSEQQSWNQRNPMRRVSARVDMNCVTFVWSLKLACKKHQRGEVNQ
jgi:hypothetical protein